MSFFTDLDQLKAELDALRPLDPEQEQRVLQKFRLEWNYNSNAIEGNSLTLGETRSLLLHGLTAAGKPLRDHIDIEGHNEAVLWLEDFVRDERPLTEQFIRGMHEVLLKAPYEVKAQTPNGQPTRKRIVPGQYKSSPNNVLTATGEMFYFASPEETPARMTDLVEWYRQQSETSALHPVALAAEFHYRFVRIHPFDDGNGRMSRLLMNLILLRHGYAITVIKAADRNRYLAALSQADAGEPEPFLRFIIENVEASLRLMIRAAKGESIDEPDDLDKKLALLKKQVLTRKDKIDTAWSPQVMATFYHALLASWFDSVAREVERYDEFFLNKRVSVNYHKVGENYYSGSKANTLAEALADAQQYFGKADTTLDHAALLFEWTTFRSVSTPFNLRLFVDFKFTKYEFEVAYRLFESEIKGAPPKSIHIIQSVYKNEYTDINTKELSHRLANKVYDFIEAKIAEANSAPS